MNRRPTFSTLFPYTTLFRSSPPMEAMMDESEPGITGGLALAKKDRKSTRLNSSHVATSYAVFCLKKKNIRDRDRQHRRHIWRGHDSGQAAAAGVFFFF